MDFLKPIDININPALVAELTKKYFSNSVTNGIVSLIADSDIEKYSPVFMTKDGKVSSCVKDSAITDNLIDVIIVQDCVETGNKITCKLKFNDNEVSNNPNVVGYIEKDNLTFIPVFMLDDGSVTTQYKYSSIKSKESFKQQSIQKLIDQDRQRRKALKKIRKENAIYRNEYEKSKKIFKNAKAKDLIREIFTKIRQSNELFIVNISHPYNSFKTEIRYLGQIGLVINVNFEHLYHDTYNLNIEIENVFDSSVLKKFFEELYNTAKNIKKVYKIRTIIKVEFLYPDWVKKNYNIDYDSKGSVKSVQRVTNY